MLDTSACVDTVLSGLWKHFAISEKLTLANADRDSVGNVAATLHADGEVSVSNVESYRVAADVEARTEDFGTFRGDIAFGGNWFFLTYDPDARIHRSELGKLTAMACAIRKAVNASGYPEVDHIEIFGEPDGEADSRNFVLCPGLEYDRSPCGTGTSAKMACLAADGKLAPNQRWIQQGVLGTSFACSTLGRMQTGEHHARIAGGLSSLRKPI